MNFLEEFFFKFNDLIPHYILFVKLLFLTLIWTPERSQSPQNPKAIIWEGSMHSVGSAPWTVAAAAVGNTHTYTEAQARTLHAHTQMLTTLNMQVLHAYFSLGNQLHVLSGFWPV